MATSSLSVGLFGPLRLVIDGRVLGPKDFGGRKPKQVLEILLVHRGQPVPKDRLADLIWGERLPRDPARTLEAYVSGVRSCLHPAGDRVRQFLRTEPGAYRFCTDDADVDAWRFDELVARAGTASAPERRRLREEALRLVSGELLADEPYADWVLPLRDLYAERHAQLLVDSAEDALASGQLDLASAQAEAVLVSQPARERAHRIVIAARYLMGEQDQALAAYDRCRRVLVEKLGVDPLEETEQLYLAVLNQEPLLSLQAATGEALMPPALSAPGPPPLPAVRTLFAFRDDSAIAYQVVGDGPLDVVFAPGWFSHIEVGWEEPRYATFLERLAKGRRLIVFDRRGVGMSDPAPTDLSVDEDADDLRAVMDAAGSQRATIFGVSGGGSTGVSLAARYPDRVAGLVLYSCVGKLMAAPDYPWGWSPEFVEMYKESLELAWTTGRGVEIALPTVSQDQALLDWVTRYLRLSVSPARMRAMLDVCQRTDIRHQLPLVQAPALVLHRRDDQWMDVGNSHYVTDHIPDSNYVELPGADYWPWFGDSDSVMAVVEPFLDNLVPR